MKGKIKTFSSYWLRHNKNNTSIHVSYLDYLKQKKPLNPQFFPYFERNFFISRLENPSLCNPPFSIEFCINGLKSIFMSYPRHIKITDYQKFFELLNKIRREDGSDIYLVKSQEIEMAVQFLENLITTHKDKSAGEIKWLQEWIITHIEEALITFKAKPKNFSETDGFSTILQLATRVDLERIYEKRIIELIVKAHQNFDNFKIGTSYFLLICELLEKQEYEFILKLHEAASFLLQREIKSALGLFKPIPTVLKKLNSTDVSIVDDLKEAILNQNELLVKKLIDNNPDTFSLGPYYYNSLSKQVLKACAADNEGKARVTRYMNLPKTAGGALSESGLFHLHLRLNSEEDKSQEKTAQEDLPENYNNFNVQDLPTGLYIAMVRAGKKTIPATFKDFLDHFQKINAKNEVRYQIDFDHFMLTHVSSIINLYELMGDDVFLFMKKMVKASGKNLERFFENFNYIPAMYFPVLQQLEQNFKKEQIKNHPSSYDQLLVCISTLETLRKELTPESEAALFEEGSPNYAVLVGSLVVNNSLTPIELISFFNQKLQAVYRKLLALPEQLNLDTSVFDNHPGLFLRLLAGRRHLKDHRLERVFDKCIEYDLRTDRDFNFFAYSLDQQDELGRRLAKHNERIKSDLKVAKINTDLAFSYPHKSSFSCITNDSIDWESLARAIYNDLNNLEGLLNPQIQTPLIQSLLMSITKIKSQVTKGKQVNLKPIYNGTLDNRLQRIHDQLTELLSTEKLSNEVKEHGMHFQQHYKDLKKEISKASSRQIKNEAIKKSFYIVPWDKNQLQSFILGDYLGCCLAPDGGQFQAMVQRRMDAAMMMHVVYDKDLQEPVCGNWLFFARNKNNPEEVFVVANFFEIRAGYGLNPQLRDRLVKELVDYTGKYAKLIGAKRFLICPLTYGLIPNFIGKFELEQINIEKIGGFFSPLSNEVVGQDSYYLTSLNVDSFFRYEDQDPKEQNSSLRIFARTAEINQTKPLAPPTLSRQSCEQ